MPLQRPAAIATKQIDNDKIIITEWRFQPGAQTGWHKHGLDYIVVPGMDGHLQLQSNDGEQMVELLEGQSYFKLAGVEHNVINPNDYEFYFIEIELR